MEKKVISLETLNIKTSQESLSLLLFFLSFLLNGCYDKKKCNTNVIQKKVRNRLHEEFFAVSEKVRECTAFLTTNQDKEVHENIKKIHVYKE